MGCPDRSSRPPAGVLKTGGVGNGSSDPARVSGEESRCACCRTVGRVSDSGLTIEHLGPCPDCEFLGDHPDPAAPGAEGRAQVGVAVVATVGVLDRDRPVGSRDRLGCPVRASQEGWPLCWSSARVRGRHSRSRRLCVRHHRGTQLSVSMAAGVVSALDVNSAHPLQVGRAFADRQLECHDVEQGPLVSRRRSQRTRDVTGTSAKPLPKGVTMVDAEIPHRRMTTPDAACLPPFPSRRWRFFG